MGTLSWDEDDSDADLLQIDSTHVRSLWHAFVGTSLRDESNARRIYMANIMEFLTLIRDRKDDVCPHITEEASLLVLGLLSGQADQGYGPLEHSISFASFTDANWKCLRVYFEKCLDDADDCLAEAREDMEQEEDETDAAAAHLMVALNARERVLAQGTMAYWRVATTALSPKVSGEAVSVVCGMHTPPEKRTAFVEFCLDQMATAQQQRTAFSSTLQSADADANIAEQSKADRGDAAEDSKQLSSQMVETAQFRCCTILSEFCKLTKETDVRHTMLMAAQARKARKKQRTWRNGSSGNGNRSRSESDDTPPQSPRAGSPQPLTKMPSFGSHGSPNPLPPAESARQDGFSILSKPQTVDKLMAFLSGRKESAAAAAGTAEAAVSPRVAARVWGLLESLPTNAGARVEMKERLQTAGSLGSAAINLFPALRDDAANVYQILHSLRLVADIVERDTTAAGQSQIAAALVARGRLAPLLALVQACLHQLSSIESPDQAEQDLSSRFMCLQASCSLASGLLETSCTGPLGPAKSTWAMLAEPVDAMLSMLPQLRFRSGLMAGSAAVHGGLTATVKLLLLSLTKFAPAVDTNDTRAKKDKQQLVSNLAAALMPFLLCTCDGEESTSAAKAAAVHLREDVCVLVEMFALLPTTSLASAAATAAATNAKTTGNNVWLPILDVLLALVPHVRDDAAVHFYGLFAELGQAACAENICDGTLVRQVQAIVSTVLAEIGKGGSGEKTCASMIYLCRAVLTRERNTLGYILPCSQPMGLVDLICDQIIGRWLLPATSRGKSAPTLPVCGGPESRRGAYALVEVLLTRASLLWPKDVFASRVLAPVFSHVRKKYGKMYAALSDDASAESSSSALAGAVHRVAPRAASGYVGLRNPCCICYMNSCLQQLFMVPAFRQGILAASTEITDTAPTAAADAGGVGEKRAPEIHAAIDPLLQLKTLFTFLEGSDRQHYDPAPFCAAVKDSDGNPTNVRIQQDADEFIRLLFDQLEPRLKQQQQQHGEARAEMDAIAEADDAKQPDLVARCFGGEVVNQIICKEPGVDYVSERVEAFKALTVEIKGKMQIEDSLKLFCEGELLEGDNAYYCDAIEPPRKVPALKRVCIRSPPTNLLLHLKRFEFDFSTMRKYKVDDYCAFPLELDLFPYTELGLAEKEGTGVALSNNKNGYTRADCAYELRGVVVHMGCADAGHYFSLIREEGDGDSWFRFNDEQVSPFDARDLPAVCYGGEEEGRNGEYSMKHHSAYMLVYRRKSAAAEEAEGRQQEEGERKTATTAVATTTTAAAAAKDMSLQQAVVKDNARWAMGRDFYDPAFVAMLRQIVILAADASTPAGDNANDSEPLRNLRDAALPLALRVFTDNVMPLARVRPRSKGGADAEEPETEESKWLNEVFLASCTASHEQCLKVLRALASTSTAGSSPTLLELLVRGPTASLRVGVANLVLRCAKHAAELVAVCQSREYGGRQGSLEDDNALQHGSEEERAREIEAQEAADMREICLAADLEGAAIDVFGRLSRLLNARKAGTQRVADFAYYFKLVLALCNNVPAAFSRFRDADLQLDLVRHFMSEAPEPTSSSAAYDNGGDRDAGWTDFFALLHRFVCGLPTGIMVRRDSFSPVGLFQVPAAASEAAATGAAEANKQDDSASTVINSSSLLGAVARDAAARREQLRSMETLSRFFVNDLQKREPVAHLVRWSLKSRDARDIVVHLCWENRMGSGTLIRGVVDEIRYCSLSQVRTLLQFCTLFLPSLSLDAGGDDNAATGFFDDSLQAWRLSTLFDENRGLIGVALYHQSRQPRKTHQILKLFADVVAQDPAGKFACDNLHVVEWACEFLREYARSLHGKHGEGKSSSASSALLRDVLWCTKQMEQALEIALEVCLQQEGKTAAAAPAQARLDAAAGAGAGAGSVSIRDLATQPRVRASAGTTAGLPGESKGP